MRLIQLICRMSRLFTAMTLIVGPTGPVYAGLASVPPSYYKSGNAIQPVGAKRTTQNAQALSKINNLKFPAYFEKNHGQADASVRFFTHAAGYNLYLTASEAVMVTPKTVIGSQVSGVRGQGADVVRMKLKGANAKPLVRGLNILPGRTNYLLGNDRSKWQTNVERYNKVRFSKIYPGIDMVYRFEQGHGKYDFVVAPGANPGRILMGFEGSKGLKLDSRGNLVISAENGVMTHKAPKLYQMFGGKRTSVKGRFVLVANKNVRFEVGDYVRSRELVIDPELGYSS